MAAGRQTSLLVQLRRTELPVSIRYLGGKDLPLVRPDGPRILQRSRPTPVFATFLLQDTYQALDCDACEVSASRVENTREKRA